MRVTDTLRPGYTRTVYANRWEGNRKVPCTKETWYVYLCDSEHPRLGPTSGWCERETRDGVPTPDEKVGTPVRGDGGGWTSKVHRIGTGSEGTRKEDSSDRGRLLGRRLFLVDGVKRGVGKGRTGRERNPDRHLVAGEV